MGPPQVPGGHRGWLIRNQRSTPPLTMMPHVNGAMPRMNISAAYTACHIESVSTSVIMSVLAVSCVEVTAKRRFSTH